MPILGRKQQVEEDIEGEEEEIAEENQDEGGDEDNEEEDEEEDEEELEEVATPWAGLKKLAERAEVMEQLRELRSAGRKQLTVLLLGKGGVGKSSTVNSLLCETVVRAQALKLQAESETLTRVLRVVEGTGSDLDGFRIRLIDTCGLEDPESGDTVNYAALQKIASELRGVPIDVILYVDRLDLYRVEPLDKAIIDAITNTFGRCVWRNAVITLTHGNMMVPPPGTTFDSFATARARALRGAIRTLIRRPELPLSLVENSEGCPSNKLQQRVLPDGSIWLAELVETLVYTALKRRPYVYQPRLTRRPNSAFKWALPFVLAGQWWIWQNVLMPRFERSREDYEIQDQDVWRYRAHQRKKLNLPPPVRPDKENAWKQEVLYEDD